MVVRRCQPHVDEVAVLLEEAGRSLFGPLALNCAAPDEGNLHLLERVASGGQRTRFLEPLARGEVRSCFAMTEPPPGAGSDPVALRTVASRTSDGWVIDGEKHLINGADGAQFCIVMAASDGGGGATMFVIGMDRPGLTIAGHARTIDTTVIGGHCRLIFDGVQVTSDDVHGEAGEGFRYAQVRLAPARLTHCMWWLGAARRAHEIAVRRSVQRELFGLSLAEQGMAQAMIADNEIDLAAARALLWQASWTLAGGDRGSGLRTSTEPSGRRAFPSSRSDCGRIAHQSLF